VKAPIPRKQGLKLLDAEMRQYFQQVKAPIPRKQGLKLSSSMIFQFVKPGESAHSKKTRIET